MIWYGYVTGFEELVNRVENSWENAGTSLGRTRSYRSRNRLRRDMVKGHPVFELFMTGSSTGVATSLYCTVCERDVSMETRGVGELGRQFMRSGYYVRVHHDLPVFNPSMDPMDFHSMDPSTCRVLISAL